MATSQFSIIKTNRPASGFFLPTSGRLRQYKDTEKPYPRKAALPEKLSTLRKKSRFYPSKNSEQFPTGSWHGTLDSIFIIFIGKHLGATRLIVGHKIGDQTVSLIGTHVGTLEANRFSTGLENHISATDKIFRSRRADDGP